MFKKISLFYFSSLILFFFFFSPPPTWKSARGAPSVPRTRHRSEGRDRSIDWGRRAWSEFCSAFSSIPAIMDWKTTDTRILFTRVRYTRGKAGIKFDRGHRKRVFNGEFAGELNLPESFGAWLNRFTIRLSIPPPISSSPPLLARRGSTRCYDSASTDWNLNRSAKFQNFRRDLFSKERKEESRISSSARSCLNRREIIKFPFITRDGWMDGSF